MNNKSICRIGVFYDGSFFHYARRHFYYKKQTGWLTFQPFHALIEEFIREKEQDFANYKVVYAGWYQGLFAADQTSEGKLRFDRDGHHELIDVGIEPKYFPMSRSGREKGIDVAMAIDVLEIGLDSEIDIAVLVTGDGDFVPLVRALMKHGVRVLAVYFEYENDERKGYANEQLLNAVNYTLNINSLENDRKYQNLFMSLFKHKQYHLSNNYEATKNLYALK